MLSGCRRATALAERRSGETVANAGTRGEAVYGAALWRPERRTCPPPPLWRQAWNGMYGRDRAATKWAVSSITGNGSVHAADAGCISVLRSAVNLPVAGPSGAARETTQGGAARGTVPASMHAVAVTARAGRGDPSGRTDPPRTECGGLNPDIGADASADWSPVRVPAASASAGRLPSAFAAWMFAIHCAMSPARSSLASAGGEGGGDAGGAGTSAAAGGSAGGSLCASMCYVYDQYTHTGEA